MIKGNLKVLGVIALMTCAFGSQAFAQAQGCIVLKSTAETEKEVVNDKGEKSKVLVPAGKIVPGTEVIWTVTANNICKQPSDKVTINNPVPEHMTLVPNSAFGPGSDVTYSVDGQKFAPAGQLTVLTLAVLCVAGYQNQPWYRRTIVVPASIAIAATGVYWAIVRGVRL